MFVDSHCHLNFPEFIDTLDGVIDDMRVAQVSHALTISVKLDECAQVIALAHRYPNLYASVGVHPDEDDQDENGTAPEATVDQLVALATDPKVIAIGETGLDYYRRNDDAFKANQQARFARHIEAARISQKPLVIHTRNASEDTLAMMREHKADQVGGILHCFTESKEVAFAALDLGFHISFSGILTFKNAHSLREVAQAIPLERTLIETDSPYLAPAPHRGKTNSPAFVPLVGAALAQVRGISLESVAVATSMNFFRLFSLSS